jgi:hypothetical protein
MTVTTRRDTCSAQLLFCYRALSESQLSCRTPKIAFVRGRDRVSSFSIWMYIVSGYRRRFCQSRNWRNSASRLAGSSATTVPVSARNCSNWPRSASAEGVRHFRASQSSAALKRCQPGTVRLMLASFHFGCCGGLWNSSILRCVLAEMFYDTWLDCMIRLMTSAAHECLFW